MLAEGFADVLQEGAALLGVGDFAIEHGQRAREFFHEVRPPGLELFLFAPEFLEFALLLLQRVLLAPQHENLFFGALHLAVQILAVQSVVRRQIELRFVGAGVGRHVRRVRKSALRFPEFLRGAAR